MISSASWGIAFIYLLNENNIKISVITERKKRLQGTKETEHYMVIYSGVDRHVRGQSRVMIWLHKSISNNIDHYTFWNDRVTETRFLNNYVYNNTKNRILTTNYVTI
jgi:hypothetical protein